MKRENLSSIGDLLKAHAVIANQIAAEVRGGRSEDSPVVVNLRGKQKGLRELMAEIEERDGAWLARVIM